jgi:diacylglycerol kinase (ATP)
MEAALALLRHAGVDAQLVLTRSGLDAIEQAQRALAVGCDTIFACGGDGTVHHIVQVLARSRAALAILPVGTANVLAHELGIPLDPVAAATASLHTTPRFMALGHVRFQDFEGTNASRVFIATAGVGMDALLFHKLNPGQKRRLGMAAYYAKAWHLWLTHRMVRFHAEYLETGTSEIRQASVTQVLAVRIRNFGGILQELAPGAALQRDDLRLVLCRTASRSLYLLCVLRGLLHQKWKIAGIDLAYSRNVSCRHLAVAGDGTLREDETVYVEADGELLGTLPVEISMAPELLTVLAPLRGGSYDSAHWSSSRHPGP